MEQVIRDLIPYGVYLYNGSMNHDVITYHTKVPQYLTTTNCTAEF
jgi:hypothetical protein